MYASAASPYKNSNQSPFRSFEPEARWGSDRQPCPLQQQADGLLTSTRSREAFQGRKSDSCDGLPQLTLTSGEKGGAAITGVEASTIGGSAAAIKGMNTDVDQINQMMSLNPTPELFSALKDQSEDQALDFAVRNPEFHRQAMHDMDDPSFEQNVRLRVTGGIG